VNIHLTPLCRDVHREEKICALGSEVVKTWFKGIAMGPEAARDALQADIDTAVAYRSHQVLRHHKGQVSFRCGLITRFLIVLLRDHGGGGVQL
jgi:hypothetical protein